MNKCKILTNVEDIGSYDDCISLFWFQYYGDHVIHHGLDSENYGLVKMDLKKFHSDTILPNRITNMVVYSNYGHVFGKKVL